MAEEIPALVSLIQSADVMTILISIAFLFGIVIMGIKKKESPIFLALANFVMVFSLYIALGVASIEFAFILILANAFMITKIVGDRFLGAMGGDTRIFVSYIMFFIVAFSFVQMVSISSTMFSAQLPQMNTAHCSANFDLLWLAHMTLCGYNMLDFFWAVMNISSSVTFINSVLFAPFIYFIYKYIIDWYRAKGNG